MARKNKITFNQKYTKLMNQTKGTLLKVEKVFPESVPVCTLRCSLEYGEPIAIEPTPKASLYLVLTFQGNRYHPFIEVRKCTQKSYNSYIAKEGQGFDFYIKKEKGDGKEKTAKKE